MKQWLVPAGLVVALWLLWKIFLWAWRAKRRRQRDFERTLGTLMQPGEQIVCQCSGKSGRWIVTNKRLVMESGNNYRALPFRKIREVCWVGADGEKASSLKNTVQLTVRAKEEYVLEGKDRSLPELAKALKARTPNRKKGKKAYPKTSPKSSSKKTAVKKAVSRKTSPKKPATKKSGSRQSASRRKK